MIQMCEECRGAGSGVQRTEVLDPDTLIVITQAWLCEACREAYQEEGADVQVVPVRQQATWAYRQTRWALRVC